MSEFEMEDLLPLVAELAQKYTSGESSSITYEKANQLMEAVLYCINEQEKDRDNTNELLEQGTKKQMLAREAYQAGYDLVCEKLKKANQCYVELMDSFDSYGSICYEETIKKGMPAFFQYYDARFAPQDTVITLDYPTIQSIYDLQGVDAIDTYLTYISSEQLFLSKLPRQYVLNVLIAYEEGYEELFDNITRIVYRSMMGHLLSNKPLSEQGYSHEQYENLAIAITMRTNKELKEQVESILTKLIQTQYENNQHLLHYLCSDLDDFVIEIRNAADHNVLDIIFPM